MKILKLLEEVLETILEFKETLVYIGNKKVHSVALFVNSKRKTQIIKENIYDPSGNRLLVNGSRPY